MFKKTIFITLMLFTVLSSIPIYADELLNPDWIPDIPKPEWAPDVSVEVAFETQYIWRGQRLVDDSVIQPGASVGLQGLTFSVWGNYDTGSLDRFTEWDYIFDYSTSIGEIKDKLAIGGGTLKFIDPLSVSLGYTFYTFPHLSGDDYTSHEFYVGLSYDMFLAPFFTYYYDFDSGDGSYLEFGGGHTVELPGNIEVVAGITAGYNAGQWEYDSSFSNLLFSGEINIPVFEYFTISPNVNYSLALDDQYDDEFYGGVKVGVAY